MALLVDRLKHLDTLDRVIILLAFLINSIVLTNSIFHHPLSGYDSDENMKYIVVLSSHLPGPEESSEFFSPPLAYFLPSIAYRFCSPTPELPCILFGGEVAQFLNFFLSIGITILCLKIAELLMPGNKYFKISVLAFLALETVYYKTFSQVRAEPYVAFFTLLLVFLLLKFLNSPEASIIKYGAWLGITIGLLVLSRQWGFLLLPAVLAFSLLLFLWKKSIAIHYIKTLSIGLFLGALLGGWFYIHLKVDYGSFTTFNRKSSSFAFTNLPVTFYRNTGLGKLLLFQSPTRKTFDNQFIPIFYSEIWGDYWGYFVFIRDKTLFGTYGNQAEITPYLGRVNFASLAPFLLMCGGGLLGILNIFRSLNKSKTDFQSLASSLLTLMIISSFAGYMWFLITHPLDAKGITVKATYMIQIFMITPFLTALFLEKIRSFQPSFYIILMSILGLVFLHNLPAMITRHFHWLI